MSSDKGIPVSTGKSEISKEIFIGVIKGAISAVPLAGGLLNEALFDIRARIEQERINSLVKKLETDFAKIEASSIDEHLLKSEQYSDVIVHVFNKTRENKYEEKLTLFSSILVASARNQEVLNDEFVHNYVEIIAALNKYEMQVMHHLYNYQKGLERKKAKEGPNARIDFLLDYSKEMILDVPKEYFGSVFDSLVAKGLALDDGVGRIGYEPRQYILPTELCTFLMKFVENTVIG